MAFFGAHNMPAVLVEDGAGSNAMSHIGMDVDQDVGHNTADLRCTTPALVEDWVPLVVQGHLRLPASAPEARGQHKNSDNLHTTRSSSDSTAHGNHQAVPGGMLSLEQAIGRQLLAALPPADEVPAWPELVNSQWAVDELMAAGQSNEAATARDIRNLPFANASLKLPSQPHNSVIGGDWQAAGSPITSRTRPYALHSCPAPCTTPCSSSISSSTSSGSTSAASSGSAPVGAGPSVMEEHDESENHDMGHRLQPQQAAGQGGVQAAVDTFRRGFELVNGLGLNLNQLGALADLLTSVRDAMEDADKLLPRDLVSGALSGIRAAAVVAAAAAASRQQQQ